MSADHRRPVVAFVVLAFLAAAVVGIHRADADDAQFLTSVLGRTGQVDGSIPTDGRSDGPGADMLQVPRGWLVGVDGRAKAGRGPAVRDGRADSPTRGQAGQQGRPAMRQKSSSGPAATAGQRRAGNRPSQSQGGSRSRAAVEKAVKKAVEEVAEEAGRDVTRRQRTDEDRSSSRARRTVEMTAESVEKTTTTTVETTEAIVREVGELARLD